MLFPSTCPVCGRPGPAPCAACRRLLHRAPPLPPPAGLDGCRSVLAYDGAARDLVARLKYRNARSALPWLAAHLAALAAPDRPDVVTWAPTTPRRRRERGFDQAELLARRVARELGVPAVRLLRRAPGPHQTGLGRAERLAAPRFVVPAGAVGHVRGRRVAVVDDVVTSGATLVRAAAALRALGASAVVGLSAARTPPAGGRPST